MLAQAKDTPPAPPGWVYEPKWDGFRAIIWPRRPPALDSRTGKDLLRYFPELAPAADQLPPGTVVDAEIVVVVDDVTEFETLQQRIHPAASRVNMLAEQTPAELVVFDLLALGGDDLRKPSRSRPPGTARRPRRRPRRPVAPHPVTDDLDVATRWFTEYEAAGCDGIIAKAAEGRYLEGKRDWIKWKHRREADCVVGGYRVHKEGDRSARSCSASTTTPATSTSSGTARGSPTTTGSSCSRRFEQLRTDESFGGDDMARVPGAQSRWSTGQGARLGAGAAGGRRPDRLRPAGGHRFRHATRFERWRPDKPAEECTLDQLERPEGAGFTDVVD